MSKVESVAQKFPNARLLRSLYVRLGALNTVHLTLNVTKRWTTTAQVRPESKHLELYDSKFGDSETITLRDDVVAIIKHDDISRLPYVLHEKDQINIIYIPVNLVIKEEQRFIKRLEEKNKFLEAW